MNVREVMTTNPRCVSPNDTIQIAARIMKEEDTGVVPIVENGRPVGVITDRDIVIRVVARGQNALDMRVGECMSEPCVTVNPEMSLVECCGLMETHKIRRVPVVDENGKLCGIVALADIADQGGKRTTSELLQKVSQPGPKTH